MEDRVNTTINRIVIVAIVIISMLGLFLLGRFLLGGNIVVDLSGIDMDNSEIIVNDKPMGFYGYNETTESMRLSDVFGEINIVINSAGYEPYEESIQVITRGTRQLQPSLVEMPAQDAAEQLSAEIFTDMKVAIVNPRYEKTSDEIERVMFFTANLDGVETLVFARYNAIDNKWEQAVYGD